MAAIVVCLFWMLFASNVAAESIQHGNSLKHIKNSPSLRGNKHNSIQNHQHKQDYEHRDLQDTTYILGSVFGDNYFSYNYDPADGFVFDVTATTTEAIKITSWEFNFWISYAGDEVSGNMFWRTGTAAGYEYEDSLGWQQLGNTAYSNETLSFPRAQSVALDFGEEMVIPAGETRGFFWKPARPTSTVFNSTINESATYSVGPAELKILHLVQLTCGQYSLREAISLNTRIHFETINTACPDDITVANDAGTCGAAVSYADVTFSSSQEEEGLTQQIEGLASGSTFPVGVTTNVFESEIMGEMVQWCTFTVTVEDTEAPQASCVPGPDYDGVVGQDNFFTLSGQDNCDVVSLMNVHLVDHTTNDGTSGGDSGFGIVDTTPEDSQGSFNVQILTGARTPRHPVVDWGLFGSGPITVSLVDDAGNISPPVLCENAAAA